MIGFTSGASSGAYQIIRLASGDQPPAQQPLWAGGGNYTRALRLGQGVTDGRRTLGVWLEFDRRSRVVHVHDCGQ